MTRSFAQDRHKRIAHHLWAFDPDKAAIIRKRDEKNFGVMALPYTALDATPGCQTTPEEDPTKANRSSDPSADNRPPGTGNQGVNFLAGFDDLIRQSANDARRKRLPRGTAGVRVPPTNMPTPVSVSARQAQDAQVGDQRTNEDIMAEIMLACSRRAPNRWQEFTNKLTGADWGKAVARARQVGPEDAAHELLTTAVKRLAFRRNGQAVIVVNVTPQGMAQMAPAPVVMPGVASAVPGMPSVPAPMPAPVPAPMPASDMIAEVPLDSLSPVTPLGLDMKPTDDAGIGADVGAKLPGGRVDVAPGEPGAMNNAPANGRGGIEPAEPEGPDLTDNIDPDIDALISQLMDAMTGGTAPKPKSEPTAKPAAKPNAPDAKPEAPDAKPEAKPEAPDAKKKFPFAAQAWQRNRRHDVQTARTAADLAKDAVPSAMVVSTQAFDPILMDAAGVRIPAGAYLQVQGMHDASQDGAYTPRGTVLDETGPGMAPIEGYRIRLFPIDSHFAGQHEFLPGWPAVLVTPTEFRQYFRRVAPEMQTMPEDDAVPEMPGESVDEFSRAPTQLNNTEFTRAPTQLSPNRPSLPPRPTNPARPGGIPSLQPTAQVKIAE